MKIILPSFIFLSLLVFGGGYFYLGNYLYAIAEENIVIHSSLDGALHNNSVIETLASGKEVQIVKCHDVKHYIIPEVVTASGKSGYINGHFKLRRMRAAYTFSGHKVFGCP